MSLPAASAMTAACGSVHLTPIPYMLSESLMITPPKPSWVRRRPITDDENSAGVLPAQTRHVDRRHHHGVGAGSDAGAEARQLDFLPRRLRFRVSRDRDVGVTRGSAQPRKVLQGRPYSTVVQALHCGSNQ